MDKLIVASGENPDQFYATGLGLEPFITLCRGKKRYLAAGGFEYDQAKAVFPKAQRYEDLGTDIQSILIKFCKQHHVRKPVLPASTPAKYWEAAKKAAPGATLSREFFPERAEKRVDELRAIKEMTRAAEDAISTVTEILARAKISGGKAKIGSTWLTSEKLRQIAAVRLAEYNAACPEMIISSGKHTALPHHRGAGVIREGTVVVDIFPRSHISHYWSDCTRTYVVGKPPKTFAERYHAVLQVQREAIRRARPGITKLSAWSAKRFRDLGFETDIRKGTGYIHTLGHGVGLEIHEAPRLNEPLRAGNVIAIEPGLYYDYGIRVEDIGAITKTSFRNFVKLAKDPYI